MAKFYSNENFRKRVIEVLRALGHDVLTSFEAGNANSGISDDDVLKYAHSQKRIVLTFNRSDFIKLHKQNPQHSGIIVCTDDSNNVALAQRIHDAILALENVDNELVRVNRPNV